MMPLKTNGKKTVSVDLSMKASLLGCWGIFVCFFYHHQTLDDDNTILHMTPCAKKCS